ncbi:putative Lipoprotein [Candidatus Sulfobium mesophilum]|uniref:Putative Lipoprotein n=1 Tax=Candidatus Sulfobium mesophilum TaxID=2016548 RepID=A0A2U3QGL5_9BACT|nr:putative Lipoprotein [Candidatus Sulfobium mesophilum]
MVAVLMSISACASPGAGEKYRDDKMDFGAIKNVAIMPFVNLSRDQSAADRVRDVFVTALLASGGVYVIPTGEVARGVGLAAIQNPTAPSTAEVIKLGPILKADAVVTGVVREYGELRSGSATANVVSLSLQMFEAQSGRLVWSTSTTKGGVGIMDRLLGGGGDPMNGVTEKAIKDLVTQFYE